MSPVWVSINTKKTIHWGEYPWFLGEAGSRIPSDSEVCSCSAHGTEWCRVCTYPTIAHVLCTVCRLLIASHAATATERVVLLAMWWITPEDVRGRAGEKAQVCNSTCCASVRLWGHPPQKAGVAAWAPAIPLLRRRQEDYRGLWTASLAPSSVRVSRE